MNRKKVALVDFKATDAGAGEFEGYGAAFDNVDFGGDRIVRGAFIETLADFKKSGLIFWQHDATDPVAYPVEATEDIKGLYLRARFHGTGSAQKARRIVQERLAAGLSFGLSIGYSVMPDGEQYDRDGVRILTRLQLHEVSLVSLPMNERAVVTGVKSAPRLDAATMAELRGIFAHAESTLALLQADDTVKGARATLAAMKDMHVYVEDADPHPFKVAVATVALGVAARHLGIRTPPMTFIEPDTTAAKGRVVMWSKTAIRGCYRGKDGVLIRVDRDIDRRSLVKTVGHEAYHAAEPPARSGDHVAADAYGASLEAAFWKTPEYKALARRFIGD